MAAAMTSLKPAALSSKAAVAPTSLRSAVGAPAAAPVARRSVVCSANGAEDVAKKAAVAVTAAALIASFGAPLDAKADVAGLTKCSESAAFAKRKKQEIKALEKRLKLYEDGSAPALALKDTIARTEKRFAAYSNSSLLCGADGLPHLIVDGDLRHAGEFLVPGLAFLYTAGWIGWVGRKYLRAISEEAKPTEKEIIIDVPLALGIIWSGLIWPIAAVAEFRSGDLLEDASNITVSPR